MFSLSVLTLVGLLASRALASISIRADPPDYCQPFDQHDSYNAYSWRDETTACQGSGHCTNACVIFVESITCGDWTSDHDADLMIGLVNQAVKDGMFETTSQGPWIFSFGAFTSAIPDRAVYNEWGYAVMDYFSVTRKTPKTIYFSTVDSKGQYYDIQADYVSC
jgi:hypothetical protein